jgi:drug/metabolite transporter (DMT)-like permease
VVVDIGLGGSHRWRFRRRVRCVLGDLHGGREEDVKKYDPLVATAYLTLLGTIMLVPFAVADAYLYQPVVFPPSFFFAALYLGILCTVIGYVFWFRALTVLTASSTGATLYFEPVVPIIFAWIILGQGIGWVAAVGGVLSWWV